MANTAKNATHALLAAGLALAERIGFTNITRLNLAAAAEVSPALVSLRLGTMPQVHRSIMRAAVKAQCLRVIAQGLAVKEPTAMRAPQELIDRAADSIKG
jgi:hypothetical protein